MSALVRVLGEVDFFLPGGTNLKMEVWALVLK
jgi:hypothetical protein